MAEAGKSASAPAEPGGTGTTTGFDLRLERGGAFVQLADQPIAPGLRLEAMLLEVPEVSFPFPAGQGAAQFRTRLCDLARFTVLIEPAAVQAALAKADFDAMGIAGVEVSFRDGAAELSGRVVGGPAFTVEAGLVPHGELGVGILFHSPCVYGPAPVAAAALPHLAARTVAALGIPAEPLPVLLRRTLAPRGWKVPRTGHVRLVRAELSPAGARLGWSRDETAAEPAGDDALLAAIEGARSFRDAEARLASGDVAGARERYLDCGPAATGHPFAAERLLSLLLVDERFHDEALDLASEWLARRPDFVPALLAEASVRMARGEDARAARALAALAAAAAARGARASALAAAEACFALSGADRADVAAAIESALALRRDHLGALRALRALALAGGDREALVRANRRLVAWSPDAVEKARAHAELGELLLAADPPAARLHLDQALRLSPEDPEALAALARACDAAGEPLRAVRARDRLRALLEARGDRAGAGGAALDAGALWEERLGHDENALLRYREACDLLPPSPAATDAHARAARVAERLGRWAEAADHHAAVLDGLELAAPGARELAARTHLALADVAVRRLDDPRSAATHLEAALDAGATDPDVRRRLDALYERHPALRLELAARHARDADPEDSTAAERLAQVALDALAQGVPGAADALRDALARGVDRDVARPALEALVADAAGRGDDAAERAHLAALVPLLPTGARPPRLLRLAALALAAGDLSAARAAADEGRTLAPRDAAAVALACDVARAQGDDAAVAERLRELAAVRPADAGPLDLERARLLVRLGDDDDADEAYAAALAALPPDLALAREHARFRQAALPERGVADPIEACAARLAAPRDAAAAFLEAAAAAFAAGDLGAALRCARRAHSRTREDPAFAGPVLARLLYRMGARGEAVVLHRKLLETGFRGVAPDEAVVLARQLAELADDLGDAELALAALDALLARKPQDADAALRRFRLDPDRARAARRLAAVANRPASARRRAGLLAVAAEATLREAGDAQLADRLWLEARVDAARHPKLLAAIERTRAAALREALGAGSAAALAALHDASAAAQAAGDRAAAQAILEEAVATERAHGLLVDAAQDLLQLDALAAAEGDFARSAERAREAAAIFRELGDLAAAAEALRRSAASDPDHEETSRLLEEVLGAQGLAEERARVQLVRAERASGKDARLALLREAAAALEQSADAEDRARAAEVWAEVARESPGDREALRAAAAILVSLGRREEAIPHLAALVREDPDDEDAAGRLADAFADRHRERAELFLARAAAATGAARALRLREAAKALFAAGDDARAKAALRDAFDASPADDAAFYAAIRDAASDPDRLDAVLAERARAVPAEAAGCHRARADALLAFGAVDRAIEAYRACVDASPEDAGALAALAEALAAARGDAAAAEVDARLVALAERRPGAVPAALVEASRRRLQGPPSPAPPAEQDAAWDHSQAGVSGVSPAPPPEAPLADEADETEEQIASLAAVLEGGPGAAGFMDALERLRARAVRRGEHRSVAALEALRAGAAETPEACGRAWLASAEALVRAGAEPDEIRTALDLAAEADPDAPEPWAVRAAVEVREGARAEAAQAWLSASIRSEGDAAAAAALEAARLFEEEGRHADAARACRAAVAARPGCVPARRVLAHEALANGDPAAAAEHLAAIPLRELPADLRGEHQRALARALSAAGRTEEAERAWAEELALEPGDAEAFARLGELALARGDVDRWLALAAQHDVALAAAGDTARRRDLRAERGRIFADRGRLEAARGAYLAALELDPGHVPTREALEELDGRAHEWAAIAAELAAEAAEAPDAAEAAALLLRAARIHRDRLAQPTEAAAALQEARVRARLSDTPAAQRVAQEADQLLEDLAPALGGASAPGSVPEPEPEPVNVPVPVHVPVPEHEQATEFESLNLAEGILQDWDFGDGNGRGHGLGHGLGEDDPIASILRSEAAASDGAGRADALERLAAHLERQGDLRGAADARAEAIATDAVAAARAAIAAATDAPPAEQVRLRRALAEALEARGDLEGAIGALLAAQGLARDDRETVEALARLTEAAGRPADALAWRERAVDLGPEAARTEGYRALAERAEALGERERAQWLWERVRAALPHDLAALEALVRHYAEGGASDRLRAVAAALEEVAGRGALAPYAASLGRAHLEAGEHAAARAWLETAYGADPTDVTLARDLARIAEKTGDHETYLRLGAVCADVIGAHDPLAAAARYRHFAEVAAGKLNDRTRAAAFLERALALVPDDADAQRAFLELGGNAAPRGLAAEERARAAASLAAFEAGEAPPPAPAPLASLPEALRARAAAPGADGPLAALLRLLAPWLEPLFPADLARRGATSRDRLGPGNAPALHAAVDAASRALRARPHVAFAVGRPGLVAAIENTQPPAIVFSSAAAALPPAGLSFLAARSLALLESGWALIGKFAPRDVGILLELACRFAGGAPPDLGLPSQRAAAFLDALARGVPPSARERAAALGADAAAELAARDPRELVVALRRSANRVGLLYAGDPCAALGVLAGLDPRLGMAAVSEPAQALSVPDLRDLALFARSGAYADLRADALGRPA